MGAIVVSLDDAEARGKRERKLIVAVRETTLFRRPSGRIHRAHGRHSVVRGRNDESSAGGGERRRSAAHCCRGSGPGHYCASKPARVADGTARPTPSGQRGGADRRCNRPGILRPQPSMFRMPLQRKEFAPFSRPRAATCCRNFTGVQFAGDGAVAGGANLPDVTDEGGQIGRTCCCCSLLGLNAC